MIAAHDSFTCYKSKNKLFNLVKFLWKCQPTTNDITKLNADYFDVRVRYNNRTGEYVTCHGLVDLNYSFKTMDDIFNFFELHPGRLVIERGDIHIPIHEFKTKFRTTNLQEFVIKENWSVLYRNKQYNSYKHKTAYHQYWKDNLSFIDNIKRIFKYKCTLKSYALIVNDFIKSEPNVITFIDYCKTK